jgi:serine/threonine protein kinase
MLENFYNEIKILSYCRHPNIVRLLDASFNGTIVKEELLDSRDEDLRQDPSRPRSDSELSY